MAPGLASERRAQHRVAVEAGLDGWDNDGVTPVPMEVSTCHLKYGNQTHNHIGSIGMVYLPKIFYHKKVN